MIFRKTGRPKYCDAGAYKVQGPEPFDKLPENFKSEAQFITTGLRSIEVKKFFWRNYRLLRRHFNKFEQSETNIINETGYANYILQCKWIAGSNE
jgi:hypothetical protein